MHLTGPQLQRQRPSQGPWICTKPYGFISRLLLPLAFWSTYVINALQDQKLVQKNFFGREVVGRGLIITCVSTEMIQLFNLLCVGRAIQKATRQYRQLLTGIGQIGTIAQ
jgi:hypothetical protein